MIRHSQRAPQHRCLALAVATAGLALATLWWVQPELVAVARAVDAGALTSQPFDRLLVWGCAAALAGCSGWLALVTALLVRDAATGRVAPRPGVPAGLRRWVLGACGLAIGAGLTSPALAQPSRPDPARPAGSGVALHALPLPDRATTTTHVSHLVLRAAHHEPPPPPGARRTTVVEPGDSLWALAHRDLGADASDLEVTRHWRAIYEANRTTIGPDPDLIRPGQRIRLPQPQDQP